jgi:hypothetical protein
VEKPVQIEEIFVENPVDNVNKLVEKWKNPGFFCGKLEFLHRIPGKNGERKCAKNPWARTIPRDCPWGGGNRSLQKFRENANSRWWKPMEEAGIMKGKEGEMYDL